MTWHILYNLPLNSNHPRSDFTLQEIYFLQAILESCPLAFSRWLRKEIIVVSETNDHKDFDVEKAEKFGSQILNALNNGALCLMLSIGHRTGLLDVLSTLPPSTSEGIAASAHLNERYVREWLGAMVTAGVVEADPETGQFRLPEEHAASLTRAAAAENIAVFSQYIGLLGGVEDEILECFRKGGGVPYEKFSRFHEVMAEDSGQSVLSSLESHILPLIPGIREQLEKGIKVLDVGCGSGRILNKLGTLFPNSRFTGLDLSQEAIETGKAEAAAQNLKNVTFQCADLSDFEHVAEVEAYDLITTFDAVHDQAKPMSVLKGIHRALKSDGTYLMQDIKASSQIHNNCSHPIGTFLYTVSCMHCMTVSLAQGGEGLGAMWGEEKTREYLTKAGFRTIQTNELAHDIQNNWYVVKK
ncbi:MAG: methyltransferase domain-containing protein [Nitrospirota bacterium]|nr:MAG: methyltransferase domain-containing protein [Nitrospirota bacterium]